jgi:hypothetical protein
VKQLRELRHMTNLQIGDSVTFDDRAYRVCGFSPMSVAPPTIHLEDAQTGECVELAADELTRRVTPARPEDDAWSP